MNKSRGKVTYSAKASAAAAAAAPEQACVPSPLGPENADHNDFTCKTTDTQEEHNTTVGDYTILL